MANRRLFSGGAAAVAIVMGVTLGGCSHDTVVVAGGDTGYTHPGRGHGPPPHAPAHGYRRKHHDAHHGGDLELVFDSGLGVYVVIGFPSHYWLDGTYYRDRSGSFELAASIDGPWSASGTLPPGLAKAKGKSPNGKGNAKGNGKGQGRGNANQD
jgi:hypothetical protein